MKTVHSAYVSAMLAIDFHVDEMPKMQRTSGRDLVLQLLLGRLNAEVQGEPRPTCRPTPATPASTSSAEQ